MKKIMFNDRFGLTQAVLEGRKTMTRRMVQSNNIVEIKTSDGVIHHFDGSYGSYHEYRDKDGKAWLAWSPYKVGKIMAIAQSYKNVSFTHCKWLSLTSFIYEATTMGDLQKSKGWDNKMFIKAALMPHRIRFTDIKLERLQDIKAYECLKEGIFEKDGMFHYNQYVAFFDPIDAFAELIDRISGKGTWESNPFVFAYTFELLKN